MERCSDRRKRKKGAPRSAKRASVCMYLCVYINHTLTWYNVIGQDPREVLLVGIFLGGRKGQRDVRALVIKRSIGRREECVCVCVGVCICEGGCQAGGLEESEEAGEAAVLSEGGEEVAFGSSGGGGGGRRVKRGEGMMMMMVVVLVVSCHGGGAWARGGKQEGIGHAICSSMEKE